MNRNITKATAGMHVTQVPSDLDRGQIMRSSWTVPCTKLALVLASVYLRGLT